MSTENNVIFNSVEISHPDLLEVISSSIGMATEQKINSVLTSYNMANHHLIGAFINGILIGIIGIEISDKNGVIKHIAVLAKYRMQNVAKQLIIYIAHYFSLKHLIAKTDDDSVEFYRKCGFHCNFYESQYGQRYHCALTVNKQE